MAAQPIYNSSVITCATYLVARIKLCRVNDRFTSRLVLTLWPLPQYHLYDCVRNSFHKLGFAAHTAAMAQA